MHHSLFLCVAMQGSVGTCVCIRVFSSVSVAPSSGLSAVECSEAGQLDTSVHDNVAVGALIHTFNQVLFVEQRVVRAKRAGGIEEALVVMAELRSPAGGQELVHVHHLTQGHHQDGTCPRQDRRGSLKRVTVGPQTFLKGGLH